MKDTTQHTITVEDFLRHSTPQKWGAHTGIQHLGEVLSELCFPECSVLLVGTGWTHEQYHDWPNLLQDLWKAKIAYLEIDEGYINKWKNGPYPLYEGSVTDIENIISTPFDVTQRNKNGQTKSGLYSLFIPMEWNYEGFIDEYGNPVFETPETAVYGPYGDEIDIGVIENWENEAEGLRGDQDALNEFYRQFPRTEEHAFRDETKDSLFNLARIYDQIDFNEGIVRDGVRLIIVNRSQD
jgi:hypothetical protein